MRSPLADQEARDRIARDLDATLVVEAAAGTGKTTALVSRMVRLLASGTATLDRIVALTFTEAAAGELKLRLRSEIERARQAPETTAEERARLTDALPHLEQARIGTIHSFCADVLRERPVEAGIDPLFEVAADDVAGEIFARAFDRWFERQLESPREGVRRVLRWRADRDESARGMLRAAAWSLIERRDFPTPWQRTPFEREPEIDALVTELADLARWAESGNPDDWFVKSLAEIASFVRDVERREALRGRDYDALEAGLRELARHRLWRWRGRRTNDGFPRDELLARRDALKERLDAFVAASGADLAPLLRDELWEVVEAYEALKSRTGCLDFLDLLVRTRDLVRGDASVRADLQRRFTHVFVDEFQDTDPLQVEILLLLAADDPSVDDWRRVRPVPGKLFLVGDPKQSIYRFRRADVALYESVKQQLLACGASLVYLTVSFRAVPDIQEAVNAAFAPRMRGDSPSQAAYVALEPCREGVTTQPAVVALPVPYPYGDRQIANFRIEESLPDAVAAFVDWLVRKSGWTVTERERPNERVPVQARHVCVLFRRFRSFGRDMTRPYARALEARQLPHLLVGGGSFHQREEIEALRCALGAVERPDDELLVYATLRGPLFALCDADLLAFRETVGSLHPFRQVPDDAPQPIAEVASALAVLRELHRGRNRRPLADTISRLLAATRAHAAFAIWPSGEQALANVARLLDLARRAERRGTISFRAFVQQLEDEAEHGEAREAPIFEEGTDGVRIMTVHRAKGLEFPVVILADMTAHETPEQPQRHVDAARGLCAMRIARCSPRELLDNAELEMQREREEATRLLYVAATRARDLLVVPVIGDERFSGWLSALDPAVYPAPERASRPEAPQGPGCPPRVGRDSVLERPPNSFGPRMTVVPGVHRPEAGEHRVVWWDPATLELGARESIGLRQQRLLAADDGNVRAEQSVVAHAAWRAERERVRTTAAAPSVRVVTPSGDEALGLALDAEPRVAPEVTVEQVASADLARPHGKRFGALVHAVLATVALDADAAAVTDAAVLHGRVLGASDEEVEAAAAAAQRALAHPLVARAAAAAKRGACRRECPVTLEVDGVLVEGVVDVAFREEDPTPGWVVVDFKSDLEIAGRLDGYRRQVELYARAVARATGEPARAVLLRV
ncbi:MAG TPA: UvrD-helicase domain-containing protein [Candidatus Binatia bacterium]